jgi:hypothetical protein
LHYRDPNEPPSGGEACRCKLVDFSYLGSSPSINIDFNIDLTDGLAQTHDVIIWASTPTRPRATASANGAGSSGGADGGSGSGDGGSGYGSSSSGVAIDCAGWYSEHLALEEWLLNGADLNGDGAIDALDWEIMR